jgi:hypothetical protein
VPEAVIASTGVLAAVPAQHLQMQVDHLLDVVSRHNAALATRHLRKFARRTATTCHYRQCVPR